MPVKHKLLPSNPDSETLRHLSSLLVSDGESASLAINRYNALCAALQDCSPSEEQTAYDLTVENWERLNQRCAALEEALDEIGGLCRALRQGGPDPMDLEGLSNALEEAVNIAHGALAASPAPEVRRCETCDGTGDVHRADGEYLGECHCSKDHTEALATQTPLAIKTAGAWDGLDLLDALPNGSMIYASPTTQDACTCPSGDGSLQHPCPRHPAHDAISEVESMVAMLEAGEWAEHVGKTLLGERLESAITTLINEQHSADAWNTRTGRQHAALSDGVRVLRELPAITDRLARFLETVRGCERLASNYSGSLDGVDEHGGDDHDDPICAVFHRLYYAMFDGDAALRDIRALLAPAEQGGDV